jgi:hypothetical protein
MAFAPPPAVAMAMGPMNPIEILISSLNTNPYLIGISMILLNLGGRHLALGLTPEQDKFFQNAWIRRAMLFIVIFVATRNVFTALWLSIGLILTIGYLFNEHSALYLFGEPHPLPPPPAPLPNITGLTPEEQEIYKRLHDKAEKVKAFDKLKKEGEAAEAAVPRQSEVEKWYKENMTILRKYIS